MSHKGRSFNFKKGLAKATEEFCLNTSFHGFKYIVTEHRSVFARILWLLITLASVCATLFLIMTLWNIFLDNPTVTTLEDSSYPVDAIDFPAVSICDLNKISRKRAEAMAYEIANWTNVDPRYVRRSMRLLGTLYDSEISQVEDLTEFQNVLDQYFVRRGIYDEYTSVKELMLKLTPSCNEFLKDCYWGNEKKSCEELFMQRLTHDGYCCAFNYVKKTSGVNVTNPIPRRQSSGIRNGLTVSVNVDLADYYYTSISSEGVLIYLTNPHDYPDQTSGGSTQVLVGVGLETFLQIVPTSVYGVEDIIQYPIEKRGCLFDTEMTTLFGTYSESDCLVDCRINSIWLLCQCVPFAFPIRKGKPVCTLADVQCLHKYAGKWASLQPMGEVEEGVLEREKFDALSCPHRCYPSCDETQYDIYVNSVPITLNNISHSGQIYPDESIIHFYYASPLSQRYKTDVVYYWFEILSLFGGISGVTIGFSLLSVVEIIMYFIYKLICYSLE